MTRASQSRRPGLMLQYDFSIAEQIDFVTRAERRGFSQVWQSEYRLGRDAVTPTVAYATETDQIQIGLGVVNPWTRNAALTAQTLSTMSELAGADRVMGGLGAWWDPLASNVGIDRHKPLRAVRETVEAIRMLLDGTDASYDGEFVTLDEVSLSFDHHDEQPPLSTGVFVGATGFKMLELTGQFADGCLGNYLVDTVYNKQAIEALGRGADRSDRSVDELDRSQLLVCAMDDDYDAAVASAKRFFLEYYAPRPSVSEARQVAGIRQEVIDDMMVELGNWPADERRISDALEVIPDDLVTNVTVCGTPEDCRERVREYSDTEFCQCPVLYPVTENVNEIIDVFGR